MPILVAVDLGDRVFSDVFSLRDRHLLCAFVCGTVPLPNSCLVGSRNTSLIGLTRCQAGQHRLGF